MARLLRGLGLLGVCLAVVSPEGTAAGPAARAADGGRAAVIRVAQKKARKGARPRPAAEPAEEPAPAAKPAEGTLKFSRDIAPILVNNCMGCHNPKSNSRGKKLDMSTFESLMKGTAEDQVIIPGTPEESHLVLRIKGEETPKMPQGANRNLSEEAITRIEQWVKEGAVLDAGIDAKAPMAKYAASPEQLRKLELAKLTPEERERQVEEAGLERWKKASPRTTPEVTSGDHFLLFSTLPKERAAAVLKAVEGQYAPVKSLLGPKAVDWGQKASLFVFTEPGNFGEFVRDAENREVESSETGSAKLSDPRPYVVAFDRSGGRAEPAPPTTSRRPTRGRRGAATANDDGAGAGRTPEGLLTENFVIGAADLAGKPPRWLKLGLGAFFASRAEGGRRAYYQTLHKDALELCQLGWASKAQDALGDNTKVEDVRAVGFAIVESLGSYRGFTAFVQGMLAGGEKLDDVLGKSMNANREQLLQMSGQYVMRRYGR